MAETQTKTMQAKQYKKPKAILFDVAGTLTQSTFIPKVLIPHFTTFHKSYLEEYFDKPQCKEIVAKIKIAAQNDPGAPKIVELTQSDRSQIIDSVSNYVEHCIQSNKENKPLIVFRFYVWFDGLDKGQIQMPVYSDVAIHIQRWRSGLGIKLYILSNGWNVATKKFMEKTNQGDLTQLIEDFFDTEYGPLNDTQTFYKIIDKIKEKPEDLMFLTKNAEEARAAKNTGINAILVLTHRKEVEAVFDSCKDIPIVRTFNEIEFTNE